MVLNNEQSEFLIHCIYNLFYFDDIYIFHKPCLLGIVQQITLQKNLILSYK